MEQQINMEVELEFSLFLQKGRTFHFLADLISLPPNATKFEACIMGLQVSLGLGVKELEVNGDSALIIS